MGSLVVQKEKAASKVDGGKKMKRGFVAVYVGEEKARFMVPTSFLSRPLFKKMLDKAVEEFGFEQSGGLVLPCSVSSFRDAQEGRGDCGVKIKRGFVAVYAGVYMERFIVPIRFLNHPIFNLLLEKRAAEHYDQTTSTGGLVLPCTALAFREALDSIKQQQQQGLYAFISRWSKS